MASCQGTPFSRWASHDIFLSKYHSLLHILRRLFFFSDNIMADVASKQQTSALFYLPRSHAQEDTQNWHKILTNLMGNLCCAREHSVQFFVQFFFTQLNCTVWLKSVWGPQDPFDIPRCTPLFRKLSFREIFELIICSAFYPIQPTPSSRHPSP